MPSSSDTRQVAHSAPAMFDLVADMEAYPDFVPLCEALAVRDRQPQGASTVLLADMTVAYKMFRQTMTTRVVLDPEECTVTANYLDGPFHHLESRWSFEEVGEGQCKVHFFIDYEFKSPLLASLMGAAFSAAFAKFSDAFAARADEIYGGGDANLARINPG